MLFAIYSGVHIYNKRWQFLSSSSKGSPLCFRYIMSMKFVVMLRWVVPKYCSTEEGVCVYWFTSGMYTFLFY